MCWKLRNKSVSRFIKPYKIKIHFNFSCIVSYYLDFAFRRYYKTDSCIISFIALGFFFSPLLHLNKIFIKAKIRLPIKRLPHLQNYRLHICAFINYFRMCKNISTEWQDWFCNVIPVCFIVSLVLFRYVLSLNYFI